MCDYTDSSQLKEWLYTPALLEQCRKRANRKARRFLAASSSSIKDESAAAETSELSSATAQQQATSAAAAQPKLLPVQRFAAGYATRQVSGIHNESSDESESENDEKYWTSSPDRGSQPLLSSDDEQLLIQFYSGKINYLIGPKADVPRLRRDVKVAATASLLFRRFYMSNSVMMYDPKAIMVAVSLVICM